jgi:hypothetical protein
LPKRVFGSLNKSILLLKAQIHKGQSLHEMFSVSSLFSKFCVWRERQNQFYRRRVSGSLMMRRNENNGFCWEYEAPQHKVIISKPFYLGKYEVIQKQWQTLMGYNHSKAKGDGLPATNISRNNAVTFTKKLNEKEGVDKYRLPSEAKWKYAIKARTDTRYFWENNGEDETKSQYAWLGKYKIQKVGQKKPNAWGLYDMAGNVWEWINDLYQENYYQYSPKIDPKGEDSGNSHIQKGGSYDGNINFARTAYKKAPKQLVSYEYSGFRLAMSADINELETFRTDFDDYYAKIYIADKSAEYSGGFTAISDKKTDKKPINVEIKDMYAKNVDDWQKFMQERKIIIYEDFNFDGKKDFAIYHGEANPDYMYENLYASQGFMYSQAFSDLTHGGMFDIDKKNRKITTIQQNGYDYSGYYEFNVAGNELKLYKEFSKELVGDTYIKYTQTIWNNDNTSNQTDWIGLNFGYLDTVAEILSFVLDKSGEKAVIFIDSSKNINYAFLDKNERVEFACPTYYLHEADSKCGRTENTLNFDFQENENKTTLSFANKDTVYFVYQSNDKNDFGITVQKDDKNYELKSKKRSLIGDLKDAIKAENIVCSSCG